MFCVVGTLVPNMPLDWPIKPWRISETICAYWEWIFPIVFSVFTKVIMHGFRWYFLLISFRMLWLHNGIFYLISLEMRMVLEHCLSDWYKARVPTPTKVKKFFWWSLSPVFTKMTTADDLWPKQHYDKSITCNQTRLVGTFESSAFRV